MAASFDLLDAQVEALGRPVGSAGVVVGEDLGAPRSEGLAERADLGDVVAGAPGDRLVEQRGGVGWGLGEVDVTNGFLSVNRP